MAGFCTLRLRLQFALLALCMSATSCRHKPSERRWYRGNLHAHSLWSDGAMLPEEVVSWYRGHGYQFIGLAEHNVIADHEKWVPASERSRRSDAHNGERPALPSAGLVSRVRDGVEEWRLQTLVELRRVFQKPGQFLLLSNEEVTNSAADRPVHLTAVNVRHPVESVNETTPALAIEHTLERIAKESQAQGYTALGIVNHPNFAWAVGAGDLARVPAARFVEIFNGHPYSASRGDVGKRPAYRLWDMSNAERVLERGWPPLFGVASDDAHVESGARAPSPGRGWIVVRCAALSAASLTDAMQRGDFYASTGVRLKQLDYDASHRVLTLSIEPEPGTTYVTEYIATKTAARAIDSGDPEDRWDAPYVGVVVSSHTNLASRYLLRDDDAFVRATVTASRRPDNPIESDYGGDATQFKQAFTQPVGWVRLLAERHRAR